MSHLFIWGMEVLLGLWRVFLLTSQSYYYISLCNSTLEISTLSIYLIPNCLFFYSCACVMHRCSLKNSTNKKKSSICIIKNIQRKEKRFRERENW